MRSWVSGIAAAVVLVASPAAAQESRPFDLEAGIVVGIILVPYPTVGVVAGPWSVRVSGGLSLVPVDNCYGFQVNLGRVVREVGDAKHTVGAVWAGFRSACGSQGPYTPTSGPKWGGQYFGAAYDFQVHGFFIEAGPAFGVSNPVSSVFGNRILNHVYGQIGYVYRFGKQNQDD